MTSIGASSSRAAISDSLTTGLSSTTNALMVFIAILSEEADTHKRMWNWPNLSVAMAFSVRRLLNLSGGRYANGNCLREDGECAYSRAYRSAPRHVGHLQTGLSTGQQNERPFLRVKTSSGSIFLLELT